MTPPMSQTQLPSAERTIAPASAPAFLVHNEGDSVAVAVQDVDPGSRRAVYMDSDRDITVQVSEMIPLGHKVALTDLAEGADVLEYGVRVGITRQQVSCGQLLHTHNIRSARWTNSL